MEDRVTLHLGVVDTPYANPGAGKSGKGARAALTTGDVAAILEQRYGIMQTFYDTHEDRIAEIMARHMGLALKNLRAGGHPVIPLDDAASEIETMLKAFIYTGEIERAGIPGVPTQAALKGVSHRKKHPYARANLRRPSFVDTRLYLDSLKAWF